MMFIFDFWGEFVICNQWRNEYYKNSLVYLENSFSTFVGMFLTKHFFSVNYIFFTHKCLLTVVCL